MMNLATLKKKTFDINQIKKLQCLCQFGSQQQASIMYGFLKSIIFSGLPVRKTQNLITGVYFNNHSKKNPNIQSTFHLKHFLYCHWFRWWFLFLETSYVYDYVIFVSLLCWVHVVVKLNFNDHYLKINFSTLNFHYLSKKLVWGNSVYYYNL